MQKLQNKLQFMLIKSQKHGKSWHLAKIMVFIRIVKNYGIRDFLFSVAISAISAVWLLKAIFIIAALIGT